MTEFKKGDRVEVRFEAEVIGVTGVASIPVQRADGRRYWMDPKHLTKVHDPLPRKIGAVIRLSTTRRAITVLTLTPSGHWFGAGSNFSFYPARVKQLADEFGFTVLYAGDDE